MTPTGTFTAPATATTAQVSVTDNDGQSDTAVITVDEIVFPLVLNPATAEIPIDSTLGFFAFGGVQPYSFTATFGSITPSGVLTAPSFATPVDVTVTDTDSPPNVQVVTINVVTTTGALSLTPGSISVQAGSTVNFATSGGVPPYSYAIIAVSPAGDGGSIDAAGEYLAPLNSKTVTIEVTDDAAATDTAQVTITTAPLQVSPTSATLDMGQQLQLAVVGGEPPYSLSATNGSVTPGGLYTAPGFNVLDQIDIYDDVAGYVFINITVNESDYVIYNNLAPDSLMATLPFNGQFTIGNVGNIAGTSDITWNVWRSSDGVARDSLMATGSEPPVAGGAEVVVPFNATWPSSIGSSYLIYDLVADDMRPENNQLSDGPFAIGPPSFTESEPNGAWDADGDVLATIDYGWGSIEWNTLPFQLQPGVVYELYGNMETDGADVFEIDVSLLETLQVTVVWDSLDVMDGIVHDGIGEYVEGGYFGDGTETLLTICVYDVAVDSECPLTNIGDSLVGYGMDPTSMFLTVGNDTTNQPPPGVNVPWNEDSGNDRPYTVYIDAR